MEDGRKGGQASTKHGIHAFQARGVAALDDSQRSRRSDLVELLREPGGVDTVLREQAADARLIVEMGLTHLAEKYGGQESGDLKYQVWSDPILARLGTYMAEARRTLAALGDVVDKPVNVTQMLEELSDKS